MASALGCVEVSSDTSIRTGDEDGGQGTCRALVRLGWGIGPGRVSDQPFKRWWGSACGVSPIPKLCPRMLHLPALPSAPGLTAAEVVGWKLLELVAALGCDWRDGCRFGRGQPAGLLEGAARWAFLSGLL